MLDVATLYAEMAPDLWWFLRRHWHTVDAAEIDDLAQEVWLRVWQRAESYRDTGAPASSWVFRIARNLLTDTLRSTGRRPVPLSLDLPLLVGAVASDDPTTSLDAAPLLAALEQLTARQREVIDRRFLGDERTRVVAEAIGVTEDGVKKLQARGMAHLRAQLTEVA